MNCVNKKTVALAGHGLSLRIASIGSVKALCWAPTSLGRSRSQ